MVLLYYTAPPAFSVQRSQERARKISLLPFLVLKGPYPAFL